MDDYIYGFKFLTPYGGTVYEGIETFYPLPRNDEKWGPVFQHPSPVSEEDMQAGNFNATCGPGRWHLMLKPNPVWAKYSGGWWPWYARARREHIVGSGLSKFGATALQLRRITPRVWWRMIRLGWCAGTDMHDAVLKNADIHGANLDHAVFTDAKMDGVNLTHAKLQDAFFECTSLYDAQFDSADMSHSRFSQCTMERALFSRATISNIRFDSCNLQSARFYNVQYSPVFRECDLRHAYFNESNLRGTLFKKCRLSYTVFDKVDLHHAFFESCDLSNSDLCECSLDEATFIKTVYNLETIWPYGFDPRKVNGLTMIA